MVVHLTLVIVDNIAVDTFVHRFFFFFFKNFFLTSTILNIKLLEKMQCDLQF